MENLKALSIFTSYFGIIFLCTIIILRSTLSPFRARASNGTSAHPTTRTALRAPIALFTLLTLTSLAFTWYHMLCFFQLSYTTWSTTIASPGTPRTFGNWLRDTKLFEEAYRIVVITPERWWWSQQIFLACFGWGVWVSYQGHGGVPGKGGKGRGAVVLISYMVVAQLVSLSVAVNMYFVDVLVRRGTELPSPPPAKKVQAGRGKEIIVQREEEQESGWAKTWLGLYLTNCFLPTSVLPTLTHTPKTSSLNKLFFPALLMPHVALFIPILFAYPVSRRFTRLLYTCSTFGSVACHAASTLVVVERVTEFLAKGKALASEGGSVEVAKWEVAKGVLGRLGETLLSTHPAVSSVSFDVIWFCLSVAIWAGIEGGAKGMWVGGGADGKEEVRVGVGRRVGRVLAAGAAMAVGGAGVGALVFAGDL